MPKIVEAYAAEVRSLQQTMEKTLAKVIRVEDFSCFITKDPFRHLFSPAGGGLYLAFGMEVFERMAQFL